MTITRGPRPSDNFAMIQNAALEDERLSYKARGLLAYLLSRPPGWTTSAERLAKDSPREGRDAVLSGLKELEVIGYLHREVKSLGRGKWSHNQTVLDVPVPPSDKEVIATGLDDSVKYDAVKPGLTNKTELNNNDSNKNDSTPNAGETSVLHSPELPALNLPDWCPRETRWITDAMALCESRGLDFETTLWNYTNSGYFGGETPNPQRYLTNWILIEVDCRKKGKPLPGHETITVDTPESLEQAFEMFWEAYPKKEQRKIAEAAFKWAVTIADAALIIKQAKGFKRKCDMEKTEHNFIPAPHNWLKASRWTDVYPSGFKSINHTGDV